MNEKELVKEKFLRCFKRHKYKLLILYLVTIASNLINIIPLYLFGNIIDYISVGELQLVIRLVIEMVILFLITTVLSIIETLLYSYLNELILKEEKETIFDKILQLKMRNFDHLEVGELISKLESDSADVVNFVTDGMIKIIIAITTMIITVAFAIKLSFRLTMISVVTFPIIITITNILNKKNREYILKERKLSDKRFSCVNESLLALGEIKILGIQNEMCQKYSSILQKVVKNNVIISTLKTAITVFNSTVMSISDWIILIYSTVLIINGDFTVGSLVAFNSFMSKFGESMNEVYNFKIYLQNLYTAVIRLNEIVSLEDEREFENNFKPKIEGNIKFENVYFRYDDNDSYILKEINLDIQKKSYYVIVGANGCGKSTLLNLIVRLYENQKGTIFLDGIKLNDIDIKHIRKDICYIKQQPYIFETTIQKNLLLANCDRTLEDAISACKLVGLHEFIESLPNKYNTKLGTDGINLSGGQKQKLAIARGVLQNPKIMLLDEITSDLDSESEIKIAELLNDLSKKFTVITIAHRVSTVLECDNIIVMDSGRIIAKGNHAELIKKCNVYKKLYKNQIKKIKEICI